MRYPPSITHRIQLGDLMRERKVFGAVAEIGVASGLFSADILRWGVPLLYLVDVWKCSPQLKGDGAFPQEWHDANLAACHHRLRDYEDRTFFLHGLSHEMAKCVPDLSLGMVYLDGSHDYAAVLRDLNAWTPKLVSGGIMAGHDYMTTAYGVHKAVNEFAMNVRLIPDNSSADSGFWFTKKDQVY